MNRRNVGMVQLGEDQGFPYGSFAGMFVSQGSGGENLDRYFAIEVFIQGAVDLL